MEKDRRGIKQGGIVAALATTLSTRQAYLSPPPGPLAGPLSLASRARRRLRRMLRTVRVVLGSRASIAHAGSPP